MTSAFESPSPLSEANLFGSPSPSPTRRCSGPVETVETKCDLRLLVDDISFRNETRCHPLTAFRFKFEKVEKHAFAYYMWDGTCSDPSNNLANKFVQASQKWMMMVRDKSAEVMSMKPRRKCTFTPVWRVSTRMQAPLTMHFWDLWVRVVNAWIPITSWSPAMSELILLWMKAMKCLGNVEDSRTSRWHVATRRFQPIVVLWLAGVMYSSLLLNLPSQKLVQPRTISRIPHQRQWRQCCTTCTRGICGWNRKNLQICSIWRPNTNWMI